MDERLKQRLVGAAVLVALAVIFLPMLLDGQPRQVERTVRLGLPERPAFEGEGETITLLEEPETEPQADTKPDEAEPVSLLPAHPPVAPAESETAVAVQSEPEPEPPAATQPVATDPPAPTPVEEARAPTTETQQEPRPDVIVRSTETVGEPSSASTPALVSPQTTPTPAQPASVAGSPATTASVQGWWLQLGVFSRQENAQRLVKSGLQAGFPCKREDFRSGARTLHRVQCGPWPDKAAAAAQRQPLLNQLHLKEARLFQGKAEQAELQARTDTAPALQGWAVQVGSFKGRVNADRLTSRLRKLDFPAYVEPLQRKQGTRYRVRVGPYASKAEAERAREKLASRASIRQGMLVKHP